jgi:hypothetical protein
VTKPRPGPPERPPQGVHWIQAKKAAEDLDQATRGRLVSLHGTRVTLLVQHERREYVVRDPEWLEWLVERYGTRIRLQERWGVLRIQDSWCREEVHVAPGWGLTL